jgi:hypothetical protein
MTWGFVASFGGLVFALAMLALWEHIEFRGGDRETTETGSHNLDVATALDRAEAAARNTEEEIIRARAALLR